MLRPAGVPLLRWRTKPCWVNFRSFSACSVSSVLVYFHHFHSSWPPGLSIEYLVARQRMPTNSSLSLPLSLHPASLKYLPPRALSIQHPLLGTRFLVLFTARVGTYCNRPTPSPKSPNAFNVLHTCSRRYNLATCFSTHLPT